MKKLFPFVSLILLAACGDKDSSENAESENILENLTFSVDTVVVDVGEEIFNPGAYYVNDLSPDRSKAYFLYMENEIHEIDLENMKLLNRFVFQEDGPDAIPKYPNSFQILPENEVFLGGYAQTGIFKVSGENVANFKVRPENLDGIPNDAAYSMTSQLHISPDKSTMVSLPGIFGEAIEGLAVINTSDMSAKILELPALELTKNYQIIYRVGNGATRTGDSQEIQFLNDRFVIYSGSTSDVYSYDWRTDSLQLHTFPHQLVPLSKTGQFTTTPDSREAQQEATRAMRKQITYGEFYWDAQREIYYRFAEMNERYDDRGNFVDAEVYLFTYDKDLNLTGETEIKEWNHALSGCLIKDGKLYKKFVKGENPAFIIYTLNF
ncbi:DUF4221 family protein [Algoriphagus vanfongensis]|uniref:DUF4221 family protein n=1 Tax=Algoriphagus vanfongensis TaxID=426371 RepID=UPI00041C47D2|nr:DUF4221 family protein [Algoriphagus vanfongensis]